jgi:hypothetical protein
MGKKKATGRNQTSKGERNNVSKKLLNQLRREYMSSPDRFINQMKALRRKKRVVLTVPNPNPNETNKRFIRQAIDGAQYMKQKMENG